jgi:ATP-dependent Clp protease ATP-binding subunit ClpA
VGEVFTALGITIGPVRELVMQRLGPGSGQAENGRLPFSAEAKKVLEVSLREALSLGSQQVGPEHLLLGLVRVGEGGASEILLELGANSKRVRREVGDRVPRPVPGRPVDVARPPRRDVRAPEIEFRPVADPMLRHLLMVSGLALTEGRQLFGVNDLLGALARDSEVSRLLLELGLDPRLLCERFGGEPPPG